MRTCTISKISLAIAITATLGGCGNRYISSRATNPLIEDRVRMGHTDQQKMSVLTSRADRRTILVFGPNKVCAEPPPDVAEAVYSQSIAALAAKDINASAGSTLQTALMQLTRRSQGLDFYRTGAFVNCMRHYNGAINDQEYATAMNDLWKDSMELAKLEIEHLPDMMSTVAQVTSPQPTPVGSTDQGSASNTESVSQGVATAEK